jgi:hypothetical protein
LEFNEVILSESMFRHRRFFWMPQPHVAAMLFNPGGDGPTSLQIVQIPNTVLSTGRGSTTDLACFQFFNNYVIKITP